MIAAGIRYAMGTLLRVEAECPRPEEAERLRDLMFTEIQRLEGLLSRYRPGSEISTVNRAAGVRPEAVSAETYAAVSQSLAFAAGTDGAFDPVDGGTYRAIRLDPVAKTIFVTKPGASLDLGGIGKGFALDRALALARESAELERVRADFGGQLLFWAREGLALSEKIAIEDPERPGRTIGGFSVDSNCSVSTSSQAERPAHLIDRRTGRAASDVRSATVAAPSATEAEGWSTALFVAGREGLGWIEGRPGVRAFLG